MRGYAVLDTETTGLGKYQNDRIVELAVVLLDHNFEIQEAHETVLNPERDLGPVSVHGINGLMASHGPTFQQAHEPLMSLLQDRILVAHNLNFDEKFLRDEFANVGVPFHGAGIDTLKLARAQGLPVHNFKLGTLCEYLGIPLADAHSALPDAVAAARLFQGLVELHGNRVTVPTLPIRFPDEIMPSGEADLSSWKSRQDISAIIGRPHEPSGFLDTLPQRGKILSEETRTAYLSTLHRCLLNGSFTLHEFEEIKRTAWRLSLSAQQVVDLGEEYLSLLVCDVLNKGTDTLLEEDEAVLTTAYEFVGSSQERVQDLIWHVQANPQMIVPGVEQYRGLFTLARGDGIVLTGEDFELGKHEAEADLRGAGFTVQNAVSHVKTKAVICNDPYSLSSKAVKARECGIPVLTEKAFHRLREAADRLAVLP